MSLTRDELERRLEYTYGDKVNGDETAWEREELLQTALAAMDERDEILTAKKRDSQMAISYYSKYQEAIADRDALAAEGRLLREALGTIREECVADGYPNVSYVPLIDEALSDAPLIAAEVERVKRLEAVAEAAEAQDPPASANLARALAAYRTGVASIVWTSPDEGNNWTIRVRYRESDG